MQPAKVRARRHEGGSCDREKRAKADADVEADQAMDVGMKVPSTRFRPRGQRAQKAQRATSCILPECLERNAEQHGAPPPVFAGCSASARATMAPHEHTQNQVAPMICQIDHPAPHLACPLQTLAQPRVAHRALQTTRLPIHERPPIGNVIEGVQVRALYTVRAVSPNASSGPLRGLAEIAVAARRPGPRTCLASDACRLLDLLDCTRLAGFGSNALSFGRFSSSGQSVFCGMINGLLKSSTTDTVLGRRDTGRDALYSCMRRICEVSTG
eukprot:89121-Rhodomonas_salina.2